MSKETKQSRYSKKVVRVELTINPESESELLISLNRLIAIHGGKNQAIKYLILNAK